MVGQKGGWEEKQREGLEVLTVTLPGDLTHLWNNLTGTDALILCSLQATQGQYYFWKVISPLHVSVQQLQEMLQAVVAVVKEKKKKHRNSNKQFFIQNFSPLSLVTNLP